jgi:hypothetical protein
MYERWAARRECQLQITGLIYTRALRELGGASADELERFDNAIAHERELPSSLIERTDLAQGPRHLCPPAGRSPGIAVDAAGNALADASVKTSTWRRLVGLGRAGFDRENGC